MTQVEPGSSWACSPFMVQRVNVGRHSRTNISTVKNLTNQLTQLTLVVLL